MSRMLKTLLTIILIIVGVMWVLTVYRSCADKPVDTGIINDGVENIDNAITSGADKLDDLYEDDEDDSEGETADGADSGAAGDGSGSSSESDSTDDEADDGDDSESDDEGSTAEYEADDDVSVAGSGISRNGGEYLVVAGAFVSKENAKKYQKQLSRKGYDSEIRVFIGSDYHSVIIGEYATRGEAVRTADKIGGEAYAHKKRYLKKRR